MSSEMVTGLSTQWLPIVFGLIYGSVIGYKVSSEELNRTSYIIILVVSFFVAIGVGTYPDYQWTLFERVIRFSEAFFSAVIGFFITMFIRRQ